MRERLRISARIGNNKVGRFFQVPVWRPNAEGWRGMVRSPRERTEVPHRARSRRARSRRGSWVVGKQFLKIRPRPERLEGRVLVQGGAGAQAAVQGLPEGCHGLLLVGVGELRLL